VSQNSSKCKPTSPLPPTRGVCDRPSAPGARRCSFSGRRMGNFACASTTERSTTTRLNMPFPCPASRNSSRSSEPTRSSPSPTSRVATTRSEWPGQMHQRRPYKVVLGVVSVTKLRDEVHAFEFLVMLFGLLNAPAIITLMVNGAQRPMLWCSWTYSSFQPPFQNTTATCMRSHNAFVKETLCSPEQVRVLLHCLQVPRASGHSLKPLGLSIQDRGRCFLPTASPG
jgi:hypothetical protein